MRVSNIQDMTLVDAKYIEKNIASIYLLKQNDKIAIIESGTNKSLPNIRKSLKKIGLSFADVEYIIPTHVHLDHAGGAGLLMQKCPNAKLIIHPKGAAHMINPEKLIAGTIAVYGKEKFKKLYETIIPIDEDRIIVAEDNFSIDFNGRLLKFIETWGHARHHFCVWDEKTKSMFTGDTFGLSYPDFDNNNKIFIFPTTTPVQFEPDELLKSIDKIMSYKPKNICLTHFACIMPNKKIVEDLKSGVKYFVKIAEKYSNHSDNKTKIQQDMESYLIKNLQKIKPNLDVDLIKNKLKNDIDLNSQGLIVWQNRLHTK